MTATVEVHMPSAPSFIQTHGIAETYVLDGWLKVELRNGCLVDCETRKTLFGSKETPAVLLGRAKLTTRERAKWQECGDAICDSMSRQGEFRMAGSGLRRHNRIRERMEATE